MLNKIKITFLHKTFCRNNMKSFSTEIQGRKINFCFDGEILELIVYSDNEYDELESFCLELDSMMYLYLGSFPEIKSIEYNGELKDIMKLANRFSTDSNFNRATMILCNITSETVNEETYIAFKNNVLRTPVYSMQYLVSSKYKAVIPVHRLTLMTHVVEGVIDIEQKKRGDIDIKLKEKYNVEKGRSLGKYFIQASVVTDFLFQANNIYNADVLNLLDCDEYLFLESITDTRNWYSHMWKEKDKTNKLKEGTPMAIYFELLYCAVRSYLIKDVLGLDVESRFIKEYLYTLHDWIVEVYSIGKEFKSNTYIMKENLEESRRKMKEIAERMAEVE